MKCEIYEKECFETFSCISVGGFFIWKTLKNEVNQKTGTQEWYNQTTKQMHSVNEGIVFNQATYVIPLLPSGIKKDGTIVFKRVDND